jgi:hypothetical protein
MYSLWPTGNCSGQINECNATTTGSPTWHICYSSDNFAVRPEKFVTSALVNPIRAGQGYKIDYAALDHAVLPTIGYSRIQGGSFDVTTQLDPAMPMPFCLNQVIESNTSIDFKDGFHDGDLNATYFNTVGDFNLTLHEIPGSEYANVDADDTPFTSNLGSSEALEITPAVIDLLHIVPYDFRLTTTLINANSADNFTYFNDLTGTVKTMAAKLKVEIQAIIADGSSAENYETDCYADTIDYLVDYNYTEITPGASLASLQYDYELDISKNSTDGISTTTGTNDNTGDFTITNFPTTIFKDGDNGSAEIELRLNFDRRRNQVVNPVVLMINDVNLTEVDSEVSSKEAVGLQATYLYSRTKPNQYFYDNITTSSTITPVMIQVYCDKWPASAANCPQVDLTSGTNEYQWWLSTAHSMANNDGNTTLTATNQGTVSPVDPTAINPIDGIDQTVTVTNTSNTTPNTVDIHFGGNTNDWLIYNKDGINIPSPFYRVRFIGGTSGWTGEGKTGHVVDDDINTKKTRRLEW